MLKPDYPLGVCQAGCGQPTRIAPKTDREQGWIIRKPRMFCSGPCAQAWNKQMGVSGAAVHLCDWFARQMDLERDALEVQAMLELIDAAEQDGALWEDAPCPKCEYRFARVESVTSLMRMLKCLDCGTRWRWLLDEARPVMSDKDLADVIVRLYQGQLTALHIRAELQVSETRVMLAIPPEATRGRNPYRDALVRVGHERGQRAHALRYEQGWSWEDIGEELGMSRAGAKKASGRFSRSRVAA